MNRNLLFTIIAVVIVGLGLFWLVDSQNDQNQNSGFGQPSPSPAVERLEAIASDPQQFLGQQVTVQGEVDEVLGVNAIVLDTPGEILNDEILVISQAPIGSSAAEVENLFDQQQARLTGTVAQFAYTTYRDTLDLSIAPDQMTIYEGRPFILTDAITTAVMQ